MRTILWLILTCIVATFAVFGALSMDNPLPCMAVAFGAWILFFWKGLRK